MPNFVPIDFDPFAEINEIEKITFTNEPQREIWLSCVIGGDEANLSYNESVSLIINGDLHFDAFKKAVDQLVLRHEALRATISPSGEKLIIYKNFPVNFNLEDISGLQKSEIKDRLTAFLHGELSTPLSLQDGPLFKVFLHKTGECEYCFTIIKHHIIGDGWSTGIILEDLGKMYSAYVKGDVILLEAASQISDYFASQANFRLTNAYQQTQDYWLNLYKGNVPEVDLPADRPRFSPRSYKGNRIDHPLSVEMVAQLKKVGAKAGSSLVTTLLAAFEVFLYRTTHQRDIVVGLPAAGQAASGLNNVVGHCVNLLPLKSHVDPALPFVDYLKKRKKEVLDAYDHQRFTFGELIKKLYIHRDASRIPLVPVLFNIDMGMDNSVFFEGLDYRLVSNPKPYENFELFLNATGSKDGIILEWSYNADLFKNETIQTFNNNYQSILEEIILDPAVTIAGLGADGNSLTHVATGAELPISPEQTLNTLIEDAVKQYSNKIAIRFKNETATYRQMNDKADQLAAFLIQNGIAAGDIVALSVDRSIEMVVSLLAILRVGAVYLPLDPEFPPDRITFMLEDAGAKLLLTSKRNKGKYPAIREIAVDEILPGSASYKKQQAFPTVTGAAAAYIIYTSGSTGKPKGVKITHRSLVNFLLSMQALPGITDNDRLLAITTISFDIAGLELYLPLISGAELVLADAEAIKDGRMLLKMLGEKNISIMQATPSTWQMMLDSGWEKQYKLKILSGGEALPKPLADKLLQRGAELWNMYGPTETTIWSTVKRVLQQDEQLTIGVPINNTRVYIMDEHGIPMPVNQPGEIYIGGEGVAIGYLNREELTAEKFIPDPYTTKPNSKLYRTGDSGKMLDHGEIMYLGRVDLQLKIRGHRIEPGEIEAVISKQSGIKQAVVVAREESPMDKRLIGYVTLDDELGSGDISSWKDRWDTLYEIGAKDKQNTADSHNIDGTLLEHLKNSKELTMQAAEWLRTTVSRIKELNAKRIYEIGSGAGQVLFELAPQVKYYMATDYAQPAIDNINKRLHTDSKKWQHVTAAVAAADDFSAIGDTPVDLVLINSVAQYFPNADYLLSVIRKAIGALKQGGCIFIGDMQGKNSLEMYHAMDHLPRANDHATITSFKEVIANRIRIEEEFVADPGFFYLLPQLLPQITGVDVQLRKGQSLNETTKYHYDVWLYVSTPIGFAKPQISYDWKDIQTIAQLQQVIMPNADAVIAVKNIPNARTAKDHRLLQLLHTANAAAAVAEIRYEVEQVTGGIHPDIFWELGDKLHFKTHVRWTTDGTDGLFDVVFIPPAQKVLIPEYLLQAHAGKDIHEFARTPFLNNEISIPKELIQKWKDNLGDVLPAYMVPETFVALKSFPLTPNAKIDRKALPKPKLKKEIEKVSERLLTNNERIVTSIWSEILGLQDIKTTDDFFQLGGHSLLAVKVMVAIEKETGKRLPIAALFNHSTIEKLARQLANDEPVKEWDALVPIKTTGSKPPLFLIHGGGLNILLFKSISEYFDDDQPVYGIQALGLNHETDIPSSIEDIARRYINDVIKVNPNGPYAIAGYSLGGFFAYEMARQLKEMGRDVKFLGMMDTYAGNNIQVGSKATHILQKIARQFRKIPFFARSFIVNPRETFEYQLIAAKKRLDILFSSGMLIPKEIFTPYQAAIYKKYSDALDAYVLSPSDIEMTLFRVDKRLYYLDDLVYLGWQKFALKGVKIQQVPGDHKTFLNPPYSKQFASILQAALDKEMQGKN